KEPEVGRSRPASGFFCWSVVRGQLSVATDNGPLTTDNRFEKVSMNHPTTPTRYVRFADAKHQIADGDLLLFRRRSLISIAGRGTHSHAAKAAWWDGDLFCLEVREWHGGRAVTLESQVKRFPTRIDVYHTNPSNRWPEYDRTRSTTMMRRLAG